MKVTRRQFLKLTGATAATFAVAELGFDLDTAMAEVKGCRIVSITPTPTVCPYCASGCGFVVFSETDAQGKFQKLLSVEGDPDNPINRGGACAKGAALFNMRNIYNEETGEYEDNPKRQQKPLYRASKDEKWEEKDWDWMLDEIAKRVKKSRDDSFLHNEKVKVKNPDGTETQVEMVVNRTEKIASMGGSGLDNEECYLHSKLMRSLGVVYLETQARI